MNPPVFSTNQMIGSMPDDEFAAWFVDAIMKDALSDYYTDLGPAATCAEFTITARRYAAHFGIQRSDLQGQFAFLCWAVGPNFWMFPGFNRILAARWPAEEDKINALFNLLGAEAEPAILVADERYWIPRMVEGNILGDGRKEHADG